MSSTSDNPVSKDADSVPSVVAKPEDAAPKSTQLGARFWAIIAGLWIVGFQVALESTIATTAMPSIIREFNIADNYVWVINASFLAT